MPRHIPSKKIEENDTIMLILRAKCNETITVELNNGMEYSGILTNIVSTDRLGKTVWITLQHVTARTATGFLFLTPPPAPPTISPLPPVDQSLPELYQGFQEQYDILRYIHNFDYGKFAALSVDQQVQIVAHLRKQQLFDQEEYEQYGQYVGETHINLKNIAKLHFPPSVDLLKQTQGYVNRLNAIRRNEKKGKGARKGQLESELLQALNTMGDGGADSDNESNNAHHGHTHGSKQTPSGKLDDIDQDGDSDDDFAALRDFY
jgi:hypothetical protein